jgi:hypothetical protein
VVKALADWVVPLVRVAESRMSRGVRRWSSGGGHHGRRRGKEEEEAKDEDEDRTGESWTVSDSTWLLCKEPTPAIFVSRSP